MALDGVRNHLGQDGGAPKIALFRTKPSIRMAHDEVKGCARAQDLFADRVGLGDEVLSAFDDVRQEVGVYLDDSLLHVDGWKCCSWKYRGWAQVELEPIVEINRVTGARPVGGVLPLDVGPFLLKGLLLDRL